MKLSSILLFINEENDKFYFVIKFNDIKFKSSKSGFSSGFIWNIFNESILFESVLG